MQMARLLDRLKERLSTSGAQVETGGNGGAPVSAVMAYLADMRDAERWAANASTGADQVDADLIKARWREIRAKHCTDRVIAQPLSVAYGDPPRHDPAKTRVVNVATSRSDRALVETLERFSDRPLMEARYEYRVHLVGGEWRLNSRVRKEPGEPSISGLL